MKKKEENVAEFTINDIVPIAAALIVAGIFIGYGQKIMGDVKGTMTAGTLEANATNDAQLGVSKLSQQFPTIGLVAAAVVVIGMLGYLVFGRK